LLAGQFVEPFSDRGGVINDRSFHFSSSVMLFVKWARSHLFASGLSDSTRLDRASGSRAAALLVPVSGQHAVRETMPHSPVCEA
jgi:hypothetical protein